MVNRIKAMWARLWRGRGRETSEHEFYDQHEASRVPVRGRGPGPLESARWRLDVVGEACHRVEQDQGRD
jgi:hypothetical protein